MILPKTLRPLRRVGPLALCFLASCSGEPEKGGGAQAAAPQAPSVVVTTVTTETVPVQREFVARTEAVEEIEVVARVEAILEAREFVEGTPVEKGQVLYRLDARTYAAEVSSAEAVLANAQANLKLAEEQVSVRAAEAAQASALAKLKKSTQDVERLRPLAEKDAVPRQDLDTALASEEVARSELAAREAELKNAQIQEEVGVLQARAQVQSAEAGLELARLNLDYCTIAAPISGLIGRTKIDTGNLVGRGEAAMLATISSIDPMYVTFSISETEYLLSTRNRENDEESIPVQLVLADDSDYPHPGEIVTAGRTVSEQTGTLQLVASFPNPDGDLRPGQFGRARLTVATVEDAVLVPQRAVLDQQGAKVVYVVDADNKAGLRTLQLGERHGSSYHVLDGLAAGDRVILEGHMKVRPGSPVKPSTGAVSAEPGQGR